MVEMLGKCGIFTKDAKANIEKRGWQHCLNMSTLQKKLSESRNVLNSLLAVFSFNVGAECAISEYYSVSDISNY